MRLSRNSFIVIGVLILIVACQEAAKTTRPVASAPTPAKKPTVKPVTEMPSIFERTGDEYSDNPVGKRDPFMLLTEDAVQDDSNTAGVPKTPLEKYSLDQLKLTAIVYGITDPRALIQAPDEQSYIVRRNTRIGRNRGRISKITKHSVIIEEEYRDPTGKLVVNEQVMELKTDEKKPEGLMEKVGGAR